MFRLLAIAIVAGFSWSAFTVTSFAADTKGTDQPSTSTVPSTTSTDPSTTTSTDQSTGDQSKKDEKKKKDKKKDPDEIGNRDVAKGVNFYSLEKEIALGKQMAQQVERQAKIIDDPHRCRVRQSRGAEHRPQLRLPRFLSPSR